jgi:prepilin-type N-terminal cleavage/methylation domain-containing protein
MTPNIRVDTLSRGFTLTELAVVLAIVALLIGSMMLPLAAQDDIRRTQETQKTLNDVRDALIGFATAKGRLPCPATTASNGLEAPIGGGACSAPYDGFVPAATLSLGPINSQHLLVDAWGQPIHYAVTTSNTQAMTITDGMRMTTLASLTPDLRVCASAPAAADLAAGRCATPETTNVLTNTAVAVIYSLSGNAGRGGTGADERHNPNVIDASNASYVAPDRVFVSHEPTPNGAPNGEFDDLVIWLSPHILFNRMIAAGRLP